MYNVVVGEEKGVGDAICSETPVPLTKQAEACSKDSCVDVCKPARIAPRAASAHEETSPHTPEDICGKEKAIARCMLQMDDHEGAPARASNAGGEDTLGDHSFAIPKPSLLGTPSIPLEISFSDLAPANCMALDSSLSKMCSTASTPFCPS